VAINEYEQQVEDMVVPDPRPNRFLGLDDEPAPNLERAVQTAITATADTQPDRFAEVLKLSKRYKLAPELAERNYDELKKHSEAEAVQPGRMASERQSLSEWLANPENMGVAKDDLDHVNDLNDTLEEHGLLDSMYTALDSGAARMNSNLLKTPAFVLDAYNNYLVNPLNRALGYGDVQSPEWLRKNAATEYYDKASEAYTSQLPEMNTSIIDEIGKGNFAKAGRALAIQFTANAPQQALTAAFAAAGMPYVGLGLAGATTAADVNARGREAGQDPTSAVNNAILQGSAEMLFESLGTIPLIKKWEAVITKQHGKDVWHSVAKDFTKTLAASVAQEGSEEMATQAVQDMSDYTTGANPDLTLKQSFENIGNAGVIGGFSGGAMTAPVGMIGGYARLHQMNESKRSVDFMTALGEKTQESKLRKRLPEAHKNLVEKLTKDGPVENILMPVEAVQEYFQSKNLDSVQEMQKLGLTKEFSEAVATGSDVKVPLATWLQSAVDTEHFNGLKNDIKFKPDSLTANEAKAEQSQNKADLELLSNEDLDTKPETELTPGEVRAKSARAVGENVRQQLLAMNNPLIGPNEAKQNAVLYTKFSMSMAARTNKTPEEIFKRYGLKINTSDGAEVIIPPTDGRVAAQYNQGSRGDWKKEGYSISSETDASDPTLHRVTAKDKAGNIVGSAEFVTQEDAPDFIRPAKDSFSLEPTVQVNEAHRRKGIATAMYEAAEAATGKKITNRRKQTRTANGNALWSQNNRPFGSRQLFQSQAAENVAEVYPAKPAPPTFSKLIQTVEQKMGGSADPAQIRGMLKEIKPEEIKWLGVDGFLEGKERVTKKEFLDFLGANDLQIQDVTSDAAEFKEQTLPGGKNYREVLFTLPMKPVDVPAVYTARDAWKAATDKISKATLKVIQNGGGWQKAKEIALEKGYITQADVDAERDLKTEYEAAAQRSANQQRANYTSRHYKEKNILAHVRLNDRTDADGKKVLFVEEIQSDWHQAGRKKGYTDEALTARKAEVRKQVEALPLKNLFEYSNAREILAAGGSQELADDYMSLFIGKNSDTVPDAPLKKTWHEYAMKRILRMAAEGGYDRVAWTTGEQQAERYDISKQVDEVISSKNDDGTWAIRVIREGRVIENVPSVAEAKLEDQLGKDLAKKIIADEGKKTWVGSKAEFSYTGVDLKVGGEGMKGFYDKILVDYTRKFVKKFGATVGETEIQSNNNDLVYYVSKNTQGNFGVFKSDPNSSSIHSLVQGRAFKTKAEAEAFRETIGSGTKVHSVDITPELKKTATEEGFSLFQSNKSTLGFISQLETEVSKMDFKEMPAGDLANRIKNLPGIKGEELEHTGVLDWLKGVEGKVSKTAVAQFLKDNGVKIEQVVLSDDFKHADKSEILGETDWQEPERDHESDDYHFKNEMEYFSDDYWNEERSSDLRAELVDDHTDEDGNVDESSLDSAIEKEKEDRAKNLALEAVESDDYPNAVYTVKDAATGWTLSGSDDNGWYSSEVEDGMGYNLEEAKVKLLPHMIEAGKLGGLVADFIKPSDIRWAAGRSESEPNAGDLTKRGNALFEKDKDRFIKDAREIHGWQLEDENYTKAKYEKDVLEEAKNAAHHEARETYNDHTNEKNSVMFPIKARLIRGRVIGNDVSGYLFKIAGESVPLAAKTIDAAKAEAIEVLIDKKMISPEKTAELAVEGAAPDVNAPTGKTRFKKFVKKGGENYREILLTTPNPEGTKPYVYESHFSNHANILAHLRLTDRVDLNGRKTLVADEIQSDTHQQGREFGYNGDDKLSPEERKVKLLEIDEALNFTSIEIDKTIDKMRIANSVAQAGKLAKDLAALRLKADELLAEKNSVSENDAVPNFPFKNTEAWSALTLKRLILMAVEQGYDAVAWMPASTHIERWGTDNISWNKTDDGTFSVGSLRQRGGMADGIDIEARARASGEQLERNGETVTSKEDLAKVITATLHRERNARSLGSLTESVWKEMQEKPSGEKNPRAEGMKFFYDKLIPKVAGQIIKKLDPAAKIEVAKFDLKDDGDIEALQIVITPAMKAKVEQGISLFQSGDKADTANARIDINSDKTMNIDLFKGKANLSTFLHETGHFYLEVMQDLSKDSSASQSLKDDYQKVREWLGAKDGELLSVDQHEQFARGFELYLAKGEAPTPELRAAFAHFKVWLISVYKNLARLKVELTPEIKEVMDRLVATDEQLADAVKGHALPLYTDPIAAGMNPERAEKYAEAIREAHLAAEEQITTKVMAHEMRKRHAAYREQEKEVEARVETEANGQKIYRALSILQRGKMPDGSELPAGVGAIKLDRQSIVDQYGKEFLDRLPRPYLYAREGGIHPEQAAELLGFESADDLLNQIANSPDKKTYIEQQTKARMDVLYPDAVMNETLSQDTIDAVLNEKQGRVLELELEHLFENNKPLVKEAIRHVARRPVKRADVKVQAVAMIASKTIGEIKPYTFERAAAKAAKQAGILLAKGDVRGAYEAKRKELLNLELFRAATDAQEFVEKSQERFNKLKGKDADLAKTRDIDLINVARAILAQHGLGQSERSAVEYLSSMQKYDPDAYQSAIAIIENSGLRPGPYKEISFDDFTVMADTVAALWDLSRSSRMMVIDGKRMEKDEIIGHLSSRIDAVKEPHQKLGYDKAVTQWEKTKLQILGGRAALRRVESWVHAIDGEVTNGTFRKFVWQPISDAVVKYRQEKVRVLTQYQDLVKAWAPGASTAPIRAENLDYTFAGKAELVAAILHTGNESNKQKLLLGREWGSKFADGSLDTSRWDAFILKMVRDGVLTKADYDFAQGVWDLLETMKPDAQKAHKAMYGFYFNEVTANAVQTPWGEYRGGYVPAIVDQTMVEDAAIRTEQDNLTKANNSFMFPTTGRGFTKSRVEQYVAPLALDIRMVGSHLDKVLRFINIEPRVKEVGRIMMDKGFRGKLAEVDPTIASEMIIPWLQRAAQQMVSTPSRGQAGKLLDRFAKNLRSRAGLQTMLGNVTNTIQQITGFTIAAVQVKPKHLRNAFVQYIKSPAAYAKMVNEKSPFMVTRTATQVMEVNKIVDEISINPSKFEKLQDFVKEHGYFLQSAAQGFVDLSVWGGAYEQAVEAGHDEATAVRSADAAVRETQGSMNPEDVSRFEAGSPLSRLFTMFYSYFNMQANLLGTEFTKTIRDSGLRKGAGRLVYIYTMGFMLPAFLSDLLVQSMGNGIDEDDDDQYLDDLLATFFTSQFSTATAMFPIIGPSVKASVNAFNDKAYDDKITTSPAISMVESAVSAPHSVYEAIANDGSKKKAARDVLTAIGLMSGIPTGPILKPLSYMADVTEGRAEPTGPIDYTRGLVTGKPGSVQ